MAVAQGIMYPKEKLPAVHGVHNVPLLLKTTNLNKEIHEQ
jgi:hypothetical protein